MGSATVDDAARFASEVLRCLGEGCLPNMSFRRASVLTALTLRPTTPFTTANSPLTTACTSVIMHVARLTNPRAGEKVSGCGGKSSLAQTGKLIEGGVGTLPPLDPCWGRR